MKINLFKLPAVLKEFWEPKFEGTSCPLCIQEQSIIKMAVNSNSVTKVDYAIQGISTESLCRAHREAEECACSKHDRSIPGGY